MLEAKEHKDNAFITLTYSDENLPEDMSVDSIELQKFMKKLRRRYEPSKLRFYAVGEYGEETQRPHYHAALFGFPGCVNQRTRIRSKKIDCCSVCHGIEDAWGLGQILVGTLTPESAAYIAGYVTKKWIWYKDGVRPPFARMSNRPGIGGGSVDEMASALLEIGYDQLDVPTAINHGGKNWPIGRYLRKRLRTRIGRDAKTPQETLDKMAQEMSELRETAFKNSRSFKKEVAAAGEGRRHKQMFWHRLSQQKRRVV